VTTAKPAILLELEPLARVLLVLLGVVVATLALRTRQHDPYPNFLLRHLVFQLDIKKTDTRSASGMIPHAPRPVNVGGCLLGLLTRERIRAPETIRTSNLRLRSPPLYPI
jgi:hypothetical protein